LKNAVLEQAYILHSRPYRDTSLLLELFTYTHGRAACVAKGARSAKKSWRYVLKPFQPLSIALTGKRELLTLVKAEANGLAHALQGSALFCGFYLNELLLNLSAKYDAYPYLFTRYQETLIALAQGDIEISLRYFERYLLADLGYGINCNFDANGREIEPTQHYIYQFDHGFMPVSKKAAETRCFQGKHLLAIAQNDYHSSEVLIAAKRLFRAKIQYLLGHKTLKSREVFLACTEN